MFTIEGTVYQTPAADHFTAERVVIAVRRRRDQRGETLRLAQS
jgi:hypothetical protein